MSTVLVSAALWVRTHTVYTGSLAARAGNTIIVGMALYTGEGQGVADQLIITIRVFTAIRIFTSLITAVTSTAVSTVSRGGTEQLMNS